MHRRGRDTIFQVGEEGADLVRRHVRCRRTFRLEQTASPKKTEEARVPLSVMVLRGWPEMTGTTAGLMFFYLARLLTALPLRSKRLAISRLPGRRPRRTRALAQLRERKGGPCVSTVSIVCGATGTAEAGASRSVVATGICRDLRAVAPSQHRIHYR